MEKISAVYKIVNTVTGDFYIGSSRNIYKRWAAHKCPSSWKERPNSKLYQDMQKYGLDKFMFQILCPVMPEYLRQVEQELIEMLKPTYNNYNAKGWDVERYKEAQKKAVKKYKQSEKGKKVQKKYNQSEKGKKVQKKYNQSEKGKKVQKKYRSRLCNYNGETLTMWALYLRFRKAGMENAVQEAKKYLKEDE